MGFTRGPWTARPTLTKGNDIGKNQQKSTCKKYSKLVQFSGKRHSVSVQLSKQLPKRPVSIATPQLDEPMDQSETPLR